MSKKLIVGNWKMNPQSIKDAEALFKGVALSAKDAKNADIVVCPPYPFLSDYKKLKTKKIKLGAQDVSEEKEGAFTGQISASMLASIGVSYVIVGHSERRLRGETNEMVNKKIIQTLKAKLVPIVCVGESVRDTKGDYLNFIRQQLRECLASLSKAQMKNIHIAYEPIWAISSNNGRQAVPEEFTEVRIFIRKVLSEIFDSKIAHSTLILYGGSVGPDDAGSFLIEGQADGLLVGRNSLSAKKFAGVIAAADTKKIY
jgi:triosephosphate isomerase